MRMKKILIPLIALMALGILCIQTASAEIAKYVVCKDTYIHPTSGTARDSGPSTTLIPQSHSGTCKGDSPFLMAGASATPAGYVGESVDGTTYGGGTSYVGSCRNALVQYTLPANMNPNEIYKATVNFTINDLSATYSASKWIRPSLYEVSADAAKCTSWDELTVKGTDIGDKGDFITLSTERITHPIYNISGGTAQPMSFDITAYLKEQIAADATKTEFAFRVAVPTDMAYIFSREYNNGQYASYIEITPGTNVTINYVDENSIVLDTKIVSAEVGSVFAPAYPQVFNVGGVEYMYSLALSDTSIEVASDGTNEMTLVYEACQDYNIGSVLTFEGKQYTIVSENKFTNPSFEANTDSWTNRGETLEWKRDDTLSYDGFYSILNGGNALSCRMPEGTTQAGKKYFFSAALRQEDTSVNAWYHVSPIHAIELVSDYYGGQYNGAGYVNGVETAGTGFAFTANEWTLQQYIIDVAPDDTAGTFTFDTKFASSTMRFDNFKLYEIEEVVLELTAEGTDSAVAQDGTGIIRFVTGVSVPEGESVEYYGTYIIPADIFDGTNGDSSTKATLQSATAITDGETYSADLVNIPAARFDTLIYAWSFAKLSGDNNISTAVFSPVSVN
ncbi:MAG: hypothetical protein Q4C12_07360 [Clostridia bacterium]|nr:hypothetical protein [Clostridia bacterium]